MNRNASPEEFITGLETAFARGASLSRSEMKGLLSLCSHLDPAVSDRALGCLLHPCAPDGEAAHYRRLFDSLGTAGFGMKLLPRAVLELVCEVGAELGELPADPRIAPWFRRIFRHLARARGTFPFDRRYPLAPFLCMIEGRLLAPGRDARTASLRRALRLLRLRLSTLPAFPSWAELTLTDLAPLLIPARNLRRFRSRGRRLGLGRRLFLPPAAPGTLPPALPSMTSVCWGGASRSRLRSMERLIRLQADELVSMRDLARQISRRTGRVVLNWHNATLAAAGGWAFDDPGSCFPYRQLYDELCREVSRRAVELERCEELRKHAVDLGELRSKRLFLPRLAQARLESRFRAAWEWEGEKVRREERERWSRCLDGQAADHLSGDGKHAWQGVMSPHQRTGTAEISGWLDREREIWASGLILLAALAGSAQQSMAKGEITELVIPWIDKFFISSRREDDLDYLPGLIRWLERAGVEPLVLFWEDTSHARTPSLQLALERLRTAGHAVRGIGIFDSAGSGRRDAVSIILREHERIRVFALRPLNDNHCPMSLDRILGEDGRLFFRNYDSSWKDNLSFLYSGTRVSTLLSIQSEMEDFSPWLALGGARIPFGAYFRGRLRQATGVREGHESDLLSARYALWANLL